MLTDPFNRPITYLRISVTDRCNLRCVYCMPAEGIQQVGHADIMRYEEITAFVRIAAQAGVSEIRLTGGEPLARLGLPNLVAMLAAVPGIRDISLTTNGLLLERFAAELKQAGLNRVNISLDTLRPERFAQITRGGSFVQVWRGILAAEAAGLAPLKINAVAMRGVNEDEFLDLARLALEHPWHIRFIELMPVSEPQPSGWGDQFPDPRSVFIPIAEVKQHLAPLGLEALEERSGSGPAHDYTIRGGLGRLGFISPLSEHFCQECNRLRLTADGHLRPCLFSDLEIPILPALRRGEDLRPYLNQAVGLKPRGHELLSNPRPLTRCMTQIGG
jgi:cyclic pyranopterin phosphate synthase